MYHCGLGGKEREVESVSTRKGKGEGVEYSTHIISSEKS